MADMVPAVNRVLERIESRDWKGLEALLSPEVHWTNAIEEQLHGREAVIAMLMHDPPPSPPSYHELDEGLITRWIDCPG